MRMVLTPEMARAAGADAGNRSMRQRNLPVWDRRCFDIAARETNRLLDTIENEKQVTPEK